MSAPPTTAMNMPMIAKKSLSLVRGRRREEVEHHARRRDQREPREERARRDREQEPAQRIVPDLRPGSAHRSFRPK